jgi:hypothetical protein
VIRFDASSLMLDMVGRYMGHNLRQFEWFSARYCDWGKSPGKVGLPTDRSSLLREKQLISTT